MKKLAMVIVMMVAGLAWGQTGQWHIVTVNTNSGDVKPRMFSVMKVSPIGMLETNEFTVAISGSAYWTNGTIAMFPPTSSAGTNRGVITFTILTENQRIHDIKFTATGENFMVSQKIAAGGQTATLTGQTVMVPAIPGGTLMFDCYVTSIGVEVYESAKQVGATNDLRGLYTLFAHPGFVLNKTNFSDYLPMTQGYYDAVVQDSVAAWASHPATTPVTLENVIQMNDGINRQQRFSWQYRPNGYLELIHVSGAEPSSVMRVEAMDPFPWIVTSSTGTISTLRFTTNGIAGVFRLQTCTDLAAGVWVNTKPISTNATTDGYLSITASNTLGGGVAFWRVSVSNAVQATTRTRFAVPVQAPRFELADDTWLFWSNGLRIHNGASNGLVPVTW